MKKIKIFSFMLLISRLLIGQTSFEIEYETGVDELLVYTFETNTGDFISVGGQKDNPYPLPNPALILKISSSGEIIDEMVYTKPDTNFFLQYGYEKSNGNYFVIGTSTDSVSLSIDENNLIYLCERTPDLNLVWEKFYEIPEPYNRQRLANFIRDADSNLIVEGIADSSMEGTDDNLITMKFDKYGNQLCLNFYDGWHNDSEYSEMIFNKDSAAIYLFGVHNHDPLSLYYEFIEMDLNLNIVNYISVIDWEHFSSVPIAVKVLPDSNFIQANESTVEPGTYHDIYVKIMDQNFNTIRDTLLCYSGWDYIPSYEGLGFIDPNQIWVPTFDPTFDYLPGSEVFRVHIFDSNLNLIGLKVYGGDRRYAFNNMAVTSDGGCLITGYVADYEVSSNYNGYIIKVMPGDIITNAEETPIASDRDVMVYPNPFDNEIRLQTVRKGLTFELYDFTGKKILSDDIHDHTESKIVSVSLPHGIYFYSILDDKRIIQSGKLIKE